MFGPRVGWKTSLGDFGVALRRADLPLLTTSTLFLWMYLSSHAFAGAANTDTAEQYATLWRHGQTGWPVYVPGFLATAWAMAARGWSGDARSEAVQGLRLMLAAAGTAVLLAPAGGLLLASRTGEGINVQDLLLGSAVHLPVGALALLSWLTLLACVNAGRARRDWRWLAVPALLYFLLAALRGGGAPFAELVTHWARSLAAEDSTAWLSIAVLVVTAWRVLGSGGIRRAKRSLSVSGDCPRNPSG